MHPKDVEQIQGAKTSIKIYNMILDNRKKKLIEIDDILKLFNDVFDILRDVTYSSSW